MSALSPLLVALVMTPGRIGCDRYCIRSLPQRQYFFHSFIVDAFAYVCHYIQYMSYTGYSRPLYVYKAPKTGEKNPSPHLLLSRLISGEYGPVAVFPESYDATEERLPR